MELTQEHRNLIEGIVRKNPRINGNEDLFEDFCSETFKKSYTIISSINDIKNLEIYLNKVASSAILDVLKTSGRLRKARSGYIQIHQQTVSISNDNEPNDILINIPDPTPHIEEKIIKHDEIKLIRDLIVQIDENEKDKRYIDIFYLRYLMGYKQSQIANETGISQGEVSKRLIELAKKINELLNKS
ncbi:MAG: sigma-70 family RNA polymerase sigma factor [Candidatus Gastranaerophilales bacterium]|nr:sigma-70 family RNA polymerase sigma factor [Candidatus Gastranaerophilales bacterium]